MIPVRVRSIERKRRHAECRDCGRSIERNESCVEISIYQEGCIFSEYSCCVPYWNLRACSFPVSEPDMYDEYEEAPF